MWDAMTDIIIIYACSGLAVIWAFINALSIIQTKLEVQSENDEEKGLLMDQKKIQLIQEIGEKISKGANSFLFKEYSIMSLFIIFFGLIVFLVVDLWG